MGTSNAERQAAWRQRRQERLDTLERTVQKLQRENSKLKDELRNSRTGKDIQQPVGTNNTTRQRQIIQELSERVGALESVLEDIADRETPGSEWHRDRARRILARK